MAKAAPSIVVGKRDVRLTAPSHIAGVREGNHPVAVEKHDIKNSRRATSIRPEDREPIDPASPYLPPA